jgi:hypothetical protein
MVRDPIKEREKTRRYRQKKHAERFGAGAGDMRGKHGNHARAEAHPRRFPGEATRGR